MGEPLNIPRYIKLVSTRELGNETIKEWYATVRDNAPHGVLFGMQVVTDRGTPKVASLIHQKIKGDKEKKTKDRHAYVIPLTRDLSEMETEKIVQAWDAAYPEKDIDIEISTQQQFKFDHGAPAVRVPNDRYLGMCLQLAKKQHEDWMKERTENGWRYGPTISLRNKTHPLLRPWDDLPAQYRKLDQHTPQTVLDLLNDFGYAVIRKEELNSLLKLMRGIA